MDARLFQRIAALFLATHALTAAASNGIPPEDSPIEFLLGGDQWQPGQYYRTGSDWLALVCEQSKCRFEPARLAVRKEKWQGPGDAQPVSGQKLAFSRQKPGTGRVLAWFRRSKEVGWLRAKEVTTYEIKRPSTIGTLEMAVDLPDGRQATLVPLVYQSPEDKHWGREYSQIYMQLRVPGQRQMLNSLARCPKNVTRDYLLWAGDIDDDGKPDYLIKFADGEGRAMLYLGGLADYDTVTGSEEIAGAAAAYEPPPYSRECDDK